MIRSVASGANESRICRVPQVSFQRDMCCPVISGYSGVDLQPAEMQ